MITKYICAFLNVRGGILYLGINDQGIVKGIYLNRKKRDEFQLEIDQNLKKFLFFLFFISIFFKRNYIKDKIIKSENNALTINDKLKKIVLNFWKIN